ncbi:insulin receptor substrate 2-B [Ditylenchus destructor]|nr:insulin receptor substrate 2-B [Ditylenchus destructor]
MSQKKDSPRITQAKNNQETCTVATTVASTSTSAPQAVSTVQENAGIIKSGVISVLFYSTKAKKTFYGVLSERCIDLHESEKSQRKKKGAKHLVDLANCFNVAQMTYPKLKVCLCLMTPDETLIIKGENDRDTVEWYEMCFGAVISSRAVLLGRPVFANEFFECTWDVTVSANPKLKKPVPNPDNFPNICLKMPELAGAHQRLCFYPHTIILAQMGIEPTKSRADLPKSGIPPFRQDEFIELSRQYIAHFGFQERYFLMRIGRSAPTGACEIWIQCDSEEAACDVHCRLTDIIERETEKKRKGLIALGALSETGTLNHAKRTPRSKDISQSKSSQSLGSKSRETISPEPSCSTVVSPARSPSSCSSPTTSNTQNCSVLSKLFQHGESLLSTISEKPAEIVKEVKSANQGRKSSMSQSLREKRIALRECKQKIDSLDEETELHRMFYENQQARFMANNQWRKNQSVEQNIAHDILRLNPPLKGGRGSLSTSNISTKYPLLAKNKISKGSSSDGSDDGLILKTCYSTSTTPPLMGEMSFVHRDSLFSSNSGLEEETEDSGGTLRINYDTNSRSASSLNLPAAGNQRFVVETHVECHTADVGFDGNRHEERTKRRGSQDTLNFRDSSINNPDFCEDENAIDETDETNSPACEAESRRHFPDDEFRRRETGISTNSAGDSENVSTTSSMSVGRQAVDDQEYTFMDKASCSSGSVSHLIVPQQWECSNNVGTPEELCSYASDSGDSCYSSMVNGHLNPRALSFSSEKCRPVNDINNRELDHGIVSLGSIGEPMKSSRNTITATIATEHKRNEGRLKTDDVSPICDSRRLNSTLAHPGATFLPPPDDESRRSRTLSLGNSSSWLAKFRKLSFNNASRSRNSPSKSGSSSLATSVHDSDSRQSYGSGFLSSSSRQPSTCSFSSSRHARSDSIDSSHSTSCSHNSIGASSLLSSRLFGSNHRSKNNSEKPPTDDLIELSFTPNNTMLSCRSSTTHSISSIAEGLQDDGPSSFRIRAESHTSRRERPPASARGSFCDYGVSGIVSKQTSEDTQETAEAKRVKPSEALIRTHKSNHSSRRVHGNQRGTGAFPLKEVRCFISPSDHEKMAALVASKTDPKEANTQHNHAETQGHFETIRERESGSGRSSASSSRNSIAESGAQRLNINSNGDIPREEDEYVCT